MHSSASHHLFHPFCLSIMLIRLICILDLIFSQQHDLVQDHLPICWTIHLFSLVNRTTVGTNHLLVKMLVFRSSLHLMAWPLLLLLQVSKLLFRVGDLVVPVSLGIPSPDRL